MEAEEFFRDAWGDTYDLEIETADRPTARAVYGVNPGEVEHFALTEEADENGNPYVYHNVALDLLAERYRPELEDSDLTYTERFEAAKERADRVGIDAHDVDTRISGNDPVQHTTCDGDQYILSRTMDKLGL